MSRRLGLSRNEVTYRNQYRNHRNHRSGAGLSRRSRIEIIETRHPVQQRRLPLYREAGKPESRQKIKDKNYHVFSLLPVVWLSGSRGVNLQYSPFNPLTGHSNVGVQQPSFANMDCRAGVPSLLSIPFVLFRVY